MATENLYPDLLITQTNLTGTVANIDDDPDSPDGNWLVPTSNSGNTVCEVSFPDASGDLNTGTASQQFRIQVGAYGNSVSPDAVSVDLYEGTTLRANLYSVTNTDFATAASGGQVLVLDWDAASLSSQAGTTDVRVRITTTADTSPPPQIATLGIGAVEWVCAYTIAGQNQIEVAAGSYAVSGQPVTFKRQLRLAAESGSYSVTGLASKARSYKSVYIDASVSGPTDPSNAWANDANAFDGSESTFASSSIAGYLFAAGMSEGFDYKKVINVRARVLADPAAATDSIGIDIRFSNYSRCYSFGVTYTGSPTWSDAALVSEPNGGFSSQSVLDGVSVYATTTGTYTVDLYKVELLLEYVPGVEWTVYTFTGTPTDPDGVWTTEANVFDSAANHSYATLAPSLIGSGVDTYELSSAGTSAPSSGGTITEVLAKFEAAVLDYDKVTANFYTSGRGELIGSIERVGEERYNEYVPLNEPTSGWSWSVLQGLEVVIYAGTDNNTSGIGAYVYEASIKVGTAIAQTNELDAATGAYSVTGQAAALQKASRLAAESGSYAVTGQAAGLTEAAKLSAATGSYSVAGQAADFDRVRKLLTETGSYVIDGRPSNLDANLLNFPTLEGSIGASSALATQLVISAPAGIVSGDLLLAWVAKDGGGDTFTTPSGWSTYGTKVGSTSTGVAVQLFYKIATGSDGSVTLASSGSSAPMMGRYIRISGADRTNPFNSGHGFVGSTTATSGTSITLSVGTTNLDQCLGLSMVGASYGTVPSVGGDWTTGSSGRTGTTSGDIGTAFASYSQLNAGALPSCVYSLSGISTTGAGFVVAINPKQPFELDAASGSYSVSGQAAAFKRGYRLAAQSGSYAVTGSQAAAKRQLRLAAESGSYATSGQQINLLRTLQLEAESGSYAVTGQPITVKRGYRLAAEPGSYATTGQPADFLLPRKLETEAGSYSVSGQPITFRRSLQLEAASGSYAVTGVNADVRMLGGPLKADGGSYSVTGQSAALTKQVKLQTEAGSYALTGVAAELDKAYRLPANSGAYALTPSSQSLLASRAMDCATGAYAISGESVEMSNTRVVAAQSGSYLISGGDAILGYTGKRIRRVIVVD